MLIALPIFVLSLSTAASTPHPEQLEIAHSPQALVAELRRDLESRRARFGATLFGRAEWFAFDEAAHRAALRGDLEHFLGDSLSSETASELLARDYFAEILERIDRGTFGGTLSATVREPQVRRWDETLWLDGERVDVTETVELGGDEPPIVVHSINAGRLQLRREQHYGETVYQELRLYEQADDTRPTTVTLLLEAARRFERVLSLAPDGLALGELAFVDLTVPTAIVEGWLQAAPSDTAFVPTVARLSLDGVEGVTVLEAEYRTRASEALLFRESLAFDAAGRPLALDLDYFALGQEPASVITARLALTPFAVDGLRRPGPLEAVDVDHELVDTRGGAPRQVVLNGEDVQNETAARMVGPWRSQALLGDRTEADADGWSVPIVLGEELITSRRYARAELERGPLRLLLMRTADAPAEPVGIEASCDCFELSTERDELSGQLVLVARLRQGYEPADRVAINMAWTSPDTAGAVAFTQLALVRDDRAPESSFLYGLLGTAREDERVQQGYPLGTLLGQRAFGISSREIAVTAIGDLTVRPRRWVEDGSGVGEVELEFGRLDAKRYGALEARVELRRRDDGSLLGAFAVLGTWLPSDLELAADESLRLVPGPETQIDTAPRLDLERGRIEGLAPEHWSLDDGGRVVVAPDAPAGPFHWTDGIRTIQLRVR